MKFDKYFSSVTDKFVDKYFVFMLHDSWKPIFKFRWWFILTLYKHVPICFVMLFRLWLWNRPSFVKLHKTVNIKIFVQTWIFKTIRNYCIKDKLILTEFSRYNYINSNINSKLVFFLNFLCIKPIDRKRSYNHDIVSVTIDNRLK